MIYGILGDIHGNKEALDAALESMTKDGVESFISVGDIVGYGADPAACIARVRDIGATVVAGNHDWAVTEQLDASFFNNYAKAAVDWTIDTLGAEDMAWLRSLPLTAVLDEEVSVAHATWANPDQFDYIQTYYDAAKSISEMETRVCFLGHSHVPLAFLMKDSLSLSVATTLDLNPISRALINVGSVGQPRDENPKTGYGLYDSESKIYKLKRIPYDMKTTRQKIRDAGLPEILAERLKFGR